MRGVVKFRFACVLIMFASPEFTTISVTQVFRSNTKGNRKLKAVASGTVQCKGMLSTFGSEGSRLVKEIPTAVAAEASVPFS